MPLQFHVNDPALGGAHRLQRHAASHLHGLVGHALRHLAQLLFAAGAVAFHVHHELHKLIRPLADDQAGDILKGVERLGVTPDQRAQVAAAHVDADGSAVGLVAFVEMRRDLRLQSHEMQDLRDDRLSLLEDGIVRGRRGGRGNGSRFTVRTGGGRGLRESGRAARSAHRQADAHLPSAHPKETFRAGVQHFHRNVGGGQAQLFEALGDGLFNSRGDDFERGAFVHKVLVIFWPRRVCCRQAGDYASWRGPSWRIGRCQAGC
ncbi:MAG: hypothetical protein PGMFKBFP_01974 [Anaerolineales bacterium]|nr:hypothetical protein [Anaerolineales bacterium]